MTFVQNQGNQQVQQVQPQIKPVQQQFVPQVVQPQPQVPTNPAYITNPQAQTPVSPSYAGVNIQIYNPSVGIPNINPTGNMVNSHAVPGMAYPSNYYTQQFAHPQNGMNGTTPFNNAQPQGNGQYAYAPGGVVAQGGQGGTANIYNTIQAPNQGNGQNADLTARPLDQNNLASNSANTTDTKNTTSTTTENTTKTEEKKKTEKRKVVELTDEYIKNLENYLNSQDKEVRMMGAKEVIARLQEDDSRKDDPALTALINKMIQDPEQNIRLLGLSMLESRVCTGNDYTVGVLKKMQNGTSGYGQDAAQATSILLKMSGKVVEKEFEVPTNSSKK